MSKTTTESSVFDHSWSPSRKAPHIWSDARARTRCADLWKIFRILFGTILNQSLLFVCPSKLHGLNLIVVFQSQSGVDFIGGNLGVFSTLGLLFMRFYFVGLRCCQENYIFFLLDPKWQLSFLRIAGGEPLCPSLGLASLCLGCERGTTWMMAALSHSTMPRNNLFSLQAFSQGRNSTPFNSGKAHLPQFTPYPRVLSEYFDPVMETSDLDSVRFRNFRHT